jgi:predicted amidohydrolase YtcJ
MVSRIFTVLGSGPAALVLLLAMLSLPGRAAEHPHADVVYEGGAVFTASGQEAEAVAVRDGQIVYVGARHGVAALVGPGTRRVHIGDGLLAPGLIDAHVHPVGVGLGLTVHCDVSGIGSAERILERIGECAREREGDAWLVGRGWALGAFPESRPSAAALDAVLPDGMAAYLTAEDGHNAWASSEALRRAGVGADTVDPPGGHIERLPDGRPQGTLRERAVSLVSSQLPTLSDAQQEDALAAALARFNGYGITTIVDAGIDEARVVQYRRLLDRGDLSARAVLALWVGPDWDEDFATLERLFDDRDARLRVSQIKLMLDGVMENQTAHLSFSYPGLGHRGTRFFEGQDARLLKWATAFENLGYQLHFHTVGDAAISEGLDLLAAVRAARAAANNRPVFAHDYLVQDSDYPRLREAGAYMQLTMLWDQQNDSMVNLNRPYLNDAQYAALMPAEDLLAAGIPVIGGSDAPVGQANPLSSMQVALTGQAVPYFDGGDFAPQPVMPGGRVALAAMLRAYTIEAARALAMDQLIGSIEVGKRADLVLFERNPLTADPRQVYGIAVRETLLDGRPVYPPPR